MLASGTETDPVPFGSAPLDGLFTQHMSARQTGAYRQPRKKE
jgi:hypothetical protein